MATTKVSRLSVATGPYYNAGGGADDDGSGIYCGSSSCWNLWSLVHGNAFDRIGLVICWSLHWLCALENNLAVLTRSLLLASSMALSLTLTECVLREEHPSSQLKALPAPASKTVSH